MTIPNSVTSIGDYAFSGCSGLTSVTIPNSVKYIYSDTFSNCIGLTSVTIGNSVTFIGSHAFYGCIGLTAVHISDLAAWCNIKFGDISANPLSIAHHLFLNGTEVKDLVIPSCITSIRDYAFYGGSSMTAVTIHDNVTSIGSSAFAGCDNLEAVSLFCSTIGNWFSDKKNIKKIVLGELISSIGTAFSGCTAVTEVHSLNSIPPEIVKNTFAAEAYENATLYVPSGCKTIYWLHPYWEDFSPIVEEDIATDIVSLPEDDSPNADASQPNVRKDVIFTLDGRRITQDKVQLPQGVYIINGKKVFIK